MKGYRHSTLRIGPFEFRAYFETKAGQQRHLSAAAEAMLAEMRDPDHPVFGVKNRQAWRRMEAKLAMAECPHCGGDLKEAPECQTS